MKTLRYIFLATLGIMFFIYLSLNYKSAPLEFLYSYTPQINTCKAHITLSHHSSMLQRPLTIELLMTDSIYGS